MSRILPLERRTVFLLLTLFTLGTGCYPDRRAVFVPKERVGRLTTIKAPTKVFLADASVALYPTGFQVLRDSIRGMAYRYSSTNVLTSRTVDNLPLRQLTVPVGDALAMTYYQEELTGGRVAASVLFGVTAGVMTASSIYCLSNPKACFGSCPTVYTSDGHDWTFEAELFSYSVSRMLEANDIDLIARHVPQGGPFQLRVTDEALETHCVNLLKLVAVHHPPGTQVFPGADGTVVAVKELHEPLRATNSEGADILPLIRSLDDRLYRSDSAMVGQVKSGRTSDWIDLHFRTPAGSRSASILLRLKNSLMSTVLFYDVVLGSQGMQALEWTKRMNTDPAYAALFRSVYQEFSGVKIKVLRDGKWAQAAVVHDVGPVGWKPVAARIPLEGGKDVSVRLEFFPDNFLIDYAGCDFSSQEEIPITEAEIPPMAVRDRSGTLREDVIPLVQEDDNRYHVTEPGDVYRFSYEIPRPQAGEMTLMVRSKGFYTEWIRGNWISRGAEGYRFDLFRIDETMVTLSEKWLRERTEMESMFFRSRIPVSEDL